jgi:hypothetical protein
MCSLQDFSLISLLISLSSFLVQTFLDAYDFFPIIALAARAVVIPYGRFTSSK